MLGLTGAVSARLEQAKGNEARITNKIRKKVFFMSSSRDMIERGISHATKKPYFAAQNKNAKGLGKSLALEI